MTRYIYQADLRQYHKIIVGEGESDLKFWGAFCADNGISGFDYAFTGMHNPNYMPSGFSEFKTFLPNLPNLPGFEQLSDIILACDHAEAAESTFKNICEQIIAANKSLKKDIFEIPAAYNQVVSKGNPRVHVLIVPFDHSGGIESLCVEVGRAHLDSEGRPGTQLLSWVDEFADKACVDWGPVKPWTVEKRDKLRLQAFISGAWKRKPDLHFSQLFDITAGHIVPLNSPAFEGVRTFLQAVEVL